VPAGSDTVLVTGTGYSSAGFQQTVTDPRGIVTQTTRDALGRPTKTIEAYINPGTPITTSSNRTTEYTYDGAGHTLTVKADEPGSLVETTQFVYGVSTTAGSDLNSNDVLAAVRYPDKSTGLPSSSEQVSYVSNALGQTKGLTDRRGTVHAYSFDVLGRLLADAIPMPGSGVDQSVLRLETSYDTGGRLAASSVPTPRC
jgi:YD repeat-containing protein